jgi:hypothetical protein
MSTQDTAQRAREIQSTLINVAAHLLNPDGFISPHAEDNPRSTPSSILNQALEQQEYLRLAAIKIRGCADSIASLEAEIERLKQRLESYEEQDEARRDADEGYLTAIEMITESHYD